MEVGKDRQEVDRQRQLCVSVVDRQKPIFVQTDRYKSSS